jgi:predicted lipid-binding transport protein (Tim44 family)
VLAPTVIKAHLEGNTKALKPWLTEGVYNKLAADIRARKHDGIEFDSNILELEENAIIMRFLENGGPVIVVVYMVQQIACVRKKGEIVEVSCIYACVCMYVRVCVYLCSVVSDDK